jgi:hypothetical protein
MNAHSRARSVLAALVAESRFVAETPGVDAAVYARDRPLALIEEPSDASRRI